MAEMQRPIISGHTDAERAVSQARYKAKESEAKRAMRDSDAKPAEPAKAKPQKQPLK